MRPALLALLLTLPVPGCGTEEPYPLRPPGGGSGVGSNAPDAGPVDAGLIDAEVSQLEGRVCVVRALADPFACPADPAAAGVAVAAVGAGTTTVSDGNGDFTIDLTAALDVLEIGGGLGDGLVPTRVTTDFTAPPVDAPALDEGFRDEILLSAKTVQTTGAMLIYIVDSGGAVAGATVAGPGSVFYDSGGVFDPSATTTGTSGVVLLVDVSAATVTASEGGRTASAFVPTVVDGFGIGVITLPDP